MTLAAPGSDGSIDPHSVAFDIDGVIADTMGLFLDIARDDYRVRNIAYRDITCYQVEECLSGLDPSLIETIFQRIQNGSYSAPLRPITGAPEILGQLAKTTGSLLFVSARNQVGPIARWISETMSVPLNAVDIVTTGAHLAKVDILKQKNVRFFVEDRLETCFALAEAGITPVVFRQPWNREPHPFAEAGTWTELAQMLSMPLQRPLSLGDNENDHPIFR